MSSFFWNSGGDPGGPPVPAPGGGGHWPGWGGMYHGPHGIQGSGGPGTVPGGATPPTLNAAGQALLAQMQGGPNFRAPGGLPPFWQQIGMSAAPTGPVGGASAGAGWAITGAPHPPPQQVGGGGHLVNPPPPGQPPPGARNWFGPPGSDPNPIYNHFYNYIMQRWPGWNGGLGPPNSQ